MLEVVEHEQRSLAPQTRAQGLFQGLALRLPQAQRPGYAGNDELRVFKRGQGDEGDVGGGEKPVGQRSTGRLQREARLADAAGAREREYPDLPEEGLNLPKFPLPAQKGRGGERKVGLRGCRCGGLGSAASTGHRREKGGPL